MSKQPLTAAAMCYVAGLLLAWAFALPLKLMACGIGFLLLLALIVSRARTFLLPVLLLAMGATNLTWRTAVLSPIDLRVVVRAEPVLATLEGKLVETPSQRIFVRNHREIWHCLAQIDVDAIVRGTNRQAAVGRVAVSTPGLLSERFFTGQEVQVSGVLGLPKGPVAEGLFDYRAYLRWQGIYYQLRAEGTNDWQLKNAASAPIRPPWPDRFLTWAQAALARDLPAVDESLRLLWAMTLGWTTALTNEVSAPFMRTGTMHIFAISGLHIALIAGILVSLLRVVRISRGSCGLIVIPLIWAYTGVSGWQSSAIRSTIMMTVVIGGWALRRPGNLLNSLMISGFIILLWEPQQLFQASFQLSFFVVLSLALLIPPFEKLREYLLRTDPLLPPELLPRWRRWLDRPIRYVTTSFVTSLAAWVGSFPLIAYYFHLVTPVSLFANMLIVPLSGLALMCNLGSIFCAAWLPPVAVLFNHSGWLWMNLMIQSSEWLARLPGAFFSIRAPTALEFFLFYLVAFGTLTGWFFRARRYVWMSAVVGGLMMLWAWQLASTRSQVRLTVLALNGGDSLYLNAPGSANDWLIDCGNETAAQFVVQPFLQAEGVNRLPRCVLTHGDLQHVGGASNLFQRFPPRQVNVGALSFRSPAYRRLMKQCEDEHVFKQTVATGDHLGDWEVLHPRADDRFTNADDKTIVLRGELHGLRVVLCSDLGRFGQRALLQRQPDLEADIVIAGLPANGEPLSAALLDAVKPQVIILSTGSYPATEQVKRSLRERLRQIAIPVFYTTEVGSVTLVAEPQHWELRAMDGARLMLRPKVRGSELTR